MRGSEGLRELANGTGQAIGLYDMDVAWPEGPSFGTLSSLQVPWMFFCD